LDTLSYLFHEGKFNFTDPLKIIVNLL